MKEKSFRNNEIFQDVSKLHKLKDNKRPWECSCRIIDGNKSFNNNEISKDLNRCEKFKMNE
jgi:hypothetical protein